MYDHSDAIEVQLPTLFRSDGSLGGLIEFDQSFVLSNAKFYANASILVLGNLVLGPNVTIEFADGCSIAVKNGGLLSMYDASLMPQIDSTFEGIILDTFNETTIDNSSLVGSTNGIHIKSSGDLSIHNTTLSDISSYAVYVDSSSTTQVIALQDVLIEQTHYGIYAPSFRGHLSVVDSSITNVTNAALYIYYSSSYYRYSRVLLENNVLSELASSSSTPLLYLYYYANATVIGNHLTCRWKCAEIYDGIEAVINDNTFKGIATSYYQQVYVYHRTTSESSFSLQRNVFSDWLMSTSGDALYADVQQQGTGLFELKDNQFYNITAGKPSLQNRLTFALYYPILNVVFV